MEYDSSLFPNEFPSRLRWPWPLFKLLHGKLSQPAHYRKQVATNLLATSDSDLEHNTLKIKSMCMQDLVHVRSTGCLAPGSLLHGILAITATHLEIDSGELESLNSMIKSAMGLANNTNMSLELLSARVNTRKTLMMNARSQGGRGKNTLAELKPIAMALARSSISMCTSQKHTTLVLHYQLLNYGPSSTTSCS